MGGGYVPKTVMSRPDPFSQAVRYDKTADSYLDFIHIVSILLWMRQFVNAS